MNRLHLLVLGALLAPSAARAAEPLAPPNLPPADTWVPTAGGQIRLLDKQKAESQLLALKVGQTVQFETLSITLRACLVHPPALPPDASAFLEITDSRESEPGFKGWMLAHEPSLSMMESPVYGVRVAGCEKPTDAAVAAAMPAAPATPTLTPQGTPKPTATPANPAGDTAPLPAQATQAAPPPATPPASVPPAPSFGGTPAPAAPGVLAAPPTLRAPGVPAPPAPAAPAAPAQPNAPASGGVY